MKTSPEFLRRNVKHARALWGAMPTSALDSLRELTRRFALCVSEGHLQFLSGHWYITHSGLLRIAGDRRCLGISTSVQESLSTPSTNRWVFKATVYKSRDSKGFVGFGDADPSNVSSLVRGAEMRVAETRAVNRALRKAYGIGLCSVEELGSQPSSIPPPREGKAVGQSNGNGSGNGQPRLRDKLCLLIRKYELDPNLVKRYAADFCGTQELRDAGRDLVEAFVSTVAEEAAKDRAALICKLNSYGQPEEVKS
jgi:hypothetical protein